MLLIVVGQRLVDEQLVASVVLYYSFAMSSFPILSIPYMYAHKFLEVHAYLIHYRCVLLRTPDTFVPCRTIPLDAAELPRQNDVKSF